MPFTDPMTPVLGTLGGSRGGFRNHFPHHSGVTLGIVLQEVVVRDPVLEFEVLVALQPESIRRVGQFNSRSGGNPLIEFDLHHLLVRKAEDLDTIAQVDAQLDGVVVVDPCGRRVVDTAVLARGSNSDSVSSGRGSGVEIREIDSQSRIEEVDALCCPVGPARPPALRQARHAHVAGPNVVEASVRLLRGEDGGVDDRPECVDVLFQVELAHSERIAIGVEPVLQRVSQQVSRWLVRSDVFDHQNIADTV